MNVQLSPILDFNSNTSKGMLFDTRDGQSYPVVKIGNQIWLAENFRYLPSLEKGDKYDTSYVYKNDNNYLDKGYGRLYDYDTANNIAPEGWRLPSNKDFQELIDFIKKDNDFGYGKDRVGSYLKSVNGWAPCDGIKPNNDKYGFSAKPAGCYVKNQKFSTTLMVMRASGVLRRAIVITPTVIACSTTKMKFSAVMNLVAVDFLLG